MSHETHLVDPVAPPTGYHRLHRDVSIDFQLNRILQYVGRDALGELEAVARRIEDYDDWTAEFLALAASARARGERERAAYYDRAAGFFMAPTDPRRGQARRRFVAEMRAAYDVAVVDVPFAGAVLPAYDLRPEGPVRETVVVCGGFDEYIEENFCLLAPYRKRGYRFVLFDGPGQGGALEEHGLPMTAEWERPVGAVLDHFGLEDVTLVGISLGGGLAIRAAAFEPRIARVVALDVLDDFLECLGRSAGVGVTVLLRAGLALRARRLINAAARLAAAHKPLAAWGVEQGVYVTGGVDAYDFFRAARDLTTRHVSRRVRADVLLLAGAEDHYVPARQLRRQAAALAGAHSVTTRLFADADAAHHCQVGDMDAAFRAIQAWWDSLRPA